MKMYEKKRVGIVGLGGDYKFHLADKKFKS